MPDKVNFSEAKRDGPQGGYHEMYLTLFRSVSEAIELLQSAQQKTEEMFITTPPMTIALEQENPASDT